MSGQDPFKDMSPEEELSELRGLGFSTPPAKRQSPSVSETLQANTPEARIKELEDKVARLERIIERNIRFRKIMDD